MRHSKLSCFEYHEPKRQGRLPCDANSTFMSVSSAASTTCSTDQLITRARCQTSFGAGPYTSKLLRRKVCNRCIAAEDVMVPARLRQTCVMTIAVGSVAFASTGDCTD